MKKIKTFFNKIFKNKKMLAITGGILIALVAILVVFFVFIKGEDQSKLLSDSLKNLGVDFYENFYYEQIGKTDEERATFLKKFETLGIKVNLDNLARYNTDKTDKILDEFVNEKSGKACDKTASQVIIYPKDPYNKTSYKIEVELECGFKEK